VSFMREADLEQLYARLEKPIYNVVYRWVWQADEAQEIVQESFVRLWRMRNRVVPATAQALVYKIALNLAASRVRRAQLWRLVPLEALGRKRTERADGEELLLEGERRARVREAVQSLPDDLRRVVMLCEFSEMSYEEIGGILCIPPGTVGSRRNRALKELRAMLSGETQADERPARQTV